MEDTTSPFPVSFPTDGLNQFTRQYPVMVASGYGLVLLLSSSGDPFLPGSPLRLGVPYQACVETPLSEVHLPGYLCPDLPGPTDTQRLCEDDMGKDEGPLVVPCPPKYPLPFRSQYGHEAAPYCA